MAEQIDTIRDEGVGYPGANGFEGSFLGSLPPDVRDALARDARLVTYSSGAKIREPGSAGRPGVVVSGVVRAYIAVEDGRQASVKYARPGDEIGLGGPFMQDSPLGLQAFGETTILYFDARAFERQLATDITLARLVAERLGRALTRASTAARGFAFGRVRQRVAAELIALASLDAHGRLVAGVTQQGLAEAVGSVRDVVARSLAELSAAGLVLTSRSKVVIMDEDALRQEADIA